MNGKLKIINVETGETLKELGNVTYDSTSRLLKQAEIEHDNEINAYADRNILAEVVIIPNK